MLSDPFSMAPPKALEAIGKALSLQYERWQPKVTTLCPKDSSLCFLLFALYFILFFIILLQRLQARYKYQLDPTVEEVKKLCNTCRKFAKTERVLFHYNGHGVPKPTANGEIWLFNRVNVSGMAGVC